MTFLRNTLLLSAALFPLCFSGFAAAAPMMIFDTKLSSGWDMGVDTEKQVRNWATVGKDGLCLNYPGGQKWGAVFITNGKPTNPPRSGKDLSSYRRVSLELRGKTGKETVLIGVKDTTDPDNGKESRVAINNVPTTWKKYEFPLSSFKTADLKNVYVPMELVFANAATSVCARNIQFLD